MSAFGLTASVISPVAAVNVALQLIAHRHSTSHLTTMNKNAKAHRLLNIVFDSNASVNNLPPPCPFGGPLPHLLQPCVSIRSAASAIELAVDDIPKRGSTSGALAV
ncbi:hypothetical protein CVT25_000836 [Psilocybe cyanescens]|uniref:Secreted protein n=1 Tax=Psilocybe cyanescens TaxID=93625 RepID=A0A409XH01_PSICY|nr:hypothetical protein CVT25_000836 [Psilocybe cyanescens]